MVCCTGNLIHSKPQQPTLPVLNHAHVPYVHHKPLTFCACTSAHFLRTRQNRTDTLQTQFPVARYKVQSCLGLLQSRDRNFYRSIEQFPSECHPISGRLGPPTWKTSPGSNRAWSTHIWIARVARIICRSGRSLPWFGNLPSRTASPPHAVCGPLKPSKPIHRGHRVPSRAGRVAHRVGPA